MSFKLLPDTNIVAFVDYSLLALWIMVGAPFVFVRLGLSSSNKIEPKYKAKADMYFPSALAFYS